MDPCSLFSSANEPTCAMCGGDGSVERLFFCRNSVWTGKWPGCFGAIHVECMPLEDKDAVGKSYTCEPCGKLPDYIASAQFVATDEEIDFNQIRFNGDHPEDAMELVENPKVAPPPSTPSISESSSDSSIQRPQRKKLRRLIPGSQQGVTQQVTTEPKKLPPGSRPTLLSRRDSGMLPIQQPVPVKRVSSDPSQRRKMKPVGKNILPRQRTMKVPKGRPLPDDLERIDQVATGTTMLKAGGSGISRYLGQPGPDTRRNTVPTTRKLKRTGSGTARDGVQKQPSQKNLEKLAKQALGEPLDDGFVPCTSTNTGSETPPYNPWEDDDPLSEPEPCPSGRPSAKDTSAPRQPPASWGRPLASSSGQLPPTPFSIKPPSSDDDRLNAFKARLGASTSTVGTSSIGSLSSDLNGQGSGNGVRNLGSEDAEVPLEDNRLTKAAAKERMKKVEPKKEAFNICSFLSDQLGEAVARDVIEKKEKQEQIYAVHRDHLWHGIIIFSGNPELLPDHLEQVGPVSFSSVPVVLPVLGCDVHTVKKIFDGEEKPLHATLHRKFDLDWLVQEKKYKEVDKQAQLEVEAPDASCRAQVSEMQKHMEMEELVGCCISRRHPELNLYLFPGSKPSTLVGFVRYNWTGKHQENTWKGILKTVGSLRKFKRVTFRSKEHHIPASGLVLNQKKALEVVLEPRHPKRIRDQQVSNIPENSGGSISNLQGVKAGPAAVPPSRILNTQERDSSSETSLKPSRKGNDIVTRTEAMSMADPLPPHLQSQSSQAPQAVMPPHPMPPAGCVSSHFRPPRDEPAQSQTHLHPAHQPHHMEASNFPSHRLPPHLTSQEEYYPLHMAHHHPPLLASHEEYHPYQNYYDPNAHGAFHSFPPPPPKVAEVKIGPVANDDNHGSARMKWDSMDVDGPYSPREGQNLPLPGHPSLQGQPPLPDQPPLPETPLPEAPLLYPREVKDIRFALVGYSGSTEELVLIQELAALGAEHIVDPHPDRVNLVSFNGFLKSKGLEGYFKMRDYLDYEVVFIWGLNELKSITASTPLPRQLTISTEAMCFRSGVLVVADKFALSACAKTDVLEIIEGLKRGNQKMPSCIWKLKVSNRCWEDLLQSQDPKTLELLDFLWKERSDPQAPRAFEKVFEFMQAQDQSSSRGKDWPPQVVRDAVKMAFLNMDRCRFVFLVHGNSEDLPEGMQSEAMEIQRAAAGQHTIQLISIPQLSEKIKWIVDRDTY